MVIAGVLLSTILVSAPDRARADSTCGHLPRPEASRAGPNDNTTSAGALKDGRITVRLVVQPASWYPDGPDGCAVQVNAFAEEGKAPLIPGPLVRARVKTEFSITIRNALQKSIWVSGLRDQTPYTRDSVEIAPGGVHEFRFHAGSPGSFYYRARQVDGGNTQLTSDVDGQLVGAFVVDPPDTAADDRVFVLTRWSQRDTKFELNAINGRSWPNTERLTLTLGDTVRWRVINGGSDIHLMHLHGFFFRVLRLGAVGNDTVFPDDRKRIVVTEFLVPGAAMSLEWVPERVGNWIFHCHLARHMSIAQRLDRMPNASSLEGTAHDAHGEHATKAMAGLILGLTVKPRLTGTSKSEPRSRRTLHLFASVRDSVFGDRPGYGFVLQEGTKPPRADSIRLPGSRIVLTRGEPTEIVVHNRLRTPFAVHWHGIELESYSDGVAGWSGANGRIAPLIAPGGSFVARMTPPRAGTFIYHIHGGHAEELVSGLYGALLVHEPGRTFDAQTDLVFVVSEPGPTSRRGDEKAPFVNGSSTPGPIDMVVGTAYRMRFIGIPANDGYWTSLRNTTGLGRWRVVARDGADTPSEADSVLAQFLIWAGTTRDIEFTPTTPGDLTLDFNVVNLGEGRLSGRITRVAIRVRAR